MDENDFIILNESLLELLVLIELGQEPINKIVINDDVWEWDNKNKRYQLMGLPLEADYLIKHRNDKFKLVN